MPETIGALILASAGAAEVGGIAGLGTLAGTTIAGASLATVVGSATIAAVSIGLQFALNNPDVPKPENGAQPLKQAVPARVRGYWVNRLAGTYMLFLPAGGDSQDVLAFHSGRIEEVLGLYLHDRLVATSGPLTHGTPRNVQPTGEGYFAPAGAVQVEVWYGTDTQSAYGLVNSTNTGSTWTPAHQGRGIACLMMVCSQAPDPQTFTQVYPQGLPLPSVVAKCSPVFDPSDGTQTRADPDTWKASPNPVLQLIDYLTRADGGLGEDFDELFPPAVLAQWIVEANLCGQIITGDRPRYSCAGFYQFDNSPDMVIGKLLASCDGFLADAGDGTLVLTVGYYREPTDPPLTEKHIKGYSVRFGTADEEQVNQVDVTYTNPDLGYVSDQIPSVRDEDAITLAGIVRAKPLELTWVQDPAQAYLLARRALLRLNPIAAGTLVTDLYGMRYLGKRWIKVQAPTIAGLEDCVIEIQDRGEVDLFGGTVTFNFQVVDPVDLAGLQ